MTTPNNQPTPPEGMEILTDYTKPTPLGTKFFDAEMGSWYLRVHNQWLPNLDIIYAIPITHPATGDTTNEKGGEPCHDPATGAADAALGVKKPADVISDAAVAVQSHDQRQDFEWDEGKHAIRELGTSDMDAIQKRFEGRKEAKAGDAKPVEQRQELDQLRDRNTKLLALVEEMLTNHADYFRHHDLCEATGRSTDGCTCWFGGQLARIAEIKEGAQ